MLFVDENSPGEIGVRLPEDNPASELLDDIIGSELLDDPEPDTMLNFHKGYQ